MKKLLCLFALSFLGLFAQAAPPVTAANVGQSITLTVTVGSGTGPFKYTWFHNNVPVVGQTANVLTVASAQLSDAGTYAVAVENAAGRTDSPSVQITIAQVIIAGNVQISVTVK